MLRPPPTREPTAPARPYRIRAPLRFAARRGALRPARCLSRRWAPAPDRILPPPTIHYCRTPLAPSVLSGIGRECSNPLPAPGRTPAGSTRSIRTPPPTARSLAGSAGAVLRQPVLHSCPYFIIKFVFGTD